jgi:hypothetical protein
VAKAKRRFYVLGPGWKGADFIGVEMDGWSGNPTTSMPFDYLEAFYQDKICTGGRLESMPRSFPDLIYGVGYAPIVTGAFKSVIESIAPGQAEFRLFALRWADDSLVRADYYLCNILNRVDCFVFPSWGQERPESETADARGQPLTPEEAWLREGYGHQAAPRPKLIDPAAIGNLHICRPRWRATEILITGDLLRALRKAGVKGLHIEEIYAVPDSLPPA